VALAVGVTTLCIAGRRPYTGALAGVVAGLTKYASFVLLPLTFRLRQWRMIITAILLGAGIVGSSVLVTGITPYRQFFGEIAPTLSLPQPWRGNQSLAGFVLRIQGGDTLSPTAATTLAAARYTTLMMILLLIWPNGRTELAWVMPASLLMLTWLLVFSPLCWEHYFVYLIPWWGWMCARATVCRSSRLLTYGAIGLSWLPLAVVPGVQVFEPFTSHMLLSLLCGGAVAVLALREYCAENSHA